MVGSFLGHMTKSILGDELGRRHVTNRSTFVGTGFISRPELGPDQT